MKTKNWIYTTSKTKVLIVRVFLVIIKLQIHFIILGAHLHPIFTNSLLEKVFKMLGVDVLVRITSHGKWSEKKHDVCSKSAVLSHLMCEVKTRQEFNYKVIWVLKVYGSRETLGLNRMWKLDFVKTTMRWFNRRVCSTSSEQSTQIIN